MLEWPGQNHRLVFCSLELERMAPKIKKSRRITSAQHMTQAKDNQLIKVVGRFEFTRKINAPSKLNFDEVTHNYNMQMSKRPLKSKLSNLHVENSSKVSPSWKNWTEGICFNDLNYFGVWKSKVCIVFPMWSCYKISVVCIVHLL